MEYKIERGIPVPQRARCGPPMKYPWADMSPGDSFVGSAKAARAAKSRSRSTEESYVSRRVGPDKYRIWRVE